MEQNEKIIQGHYQALRSERERRLEEYYGKRAFSCVHTLSDQLCPNFEEYGSCDVVSLDHMHTRERAIIGELYGITRDELERVSKICEEYNLSLDITAELSIYNIGCTVLVAVKRYSPGHRWGC